MEEDSQNFDFLVSDRPLEEVFFYPMLSYVSYMEDTNALDVTGTLPPSLSIHSSTPFAKEPLKEFLTKPHSHHLCQHDPEGSPSFTSSNGRYYTKNACKNIIKKSFRSIQKKTYESTLKELCLQHQMDIDLFHSEIMLILETISGPSALKKLLVRGKVGTVFKGYLRWYLKERYVREAVKTGHMRHLKMYIEYKNNVISKLL